jgi:hypothetical protein
MNPRDDDGDWLRALAGRSPDGMQPASALEARLLRDALRRTAEPAAAASSAALVPTPAEARDFQHRLERERAGRRSNCESCARLKAWFADRWRPLVGAIASLTAAAVVVWSQLPSLSDPPVMRGADPSVVQLRAAADPQRQRDELARQLTGMGADVRRYERLGRFGIDARFATTPTAAVEQQLEALGLRAAATADGVVRVEFEAPSR